MFILLLPVVEMGGNVSAGHILEKPLVLMLGTKVGGGR